MPGPPATLVASALQTFRIKLRNQLTRACLLYIARRENAKARLPCLFRTSMMVDLVMRGNAGNSQLVRPVLLVLEAGGNPHGQMTMGASQ